VLQDVGERGHHLGRRQTVVGEGGDEIDERGAGRGDALENGCAAR